VGKQAGAIGMFPNPYAELGELVQSSKSWYTSRNHSPQIQPQLLSYAINQTLSALALDISKRQTNDLRPTYILELSGGELRSCEILAFKSNSLILAFTQNAKS
jgi:hypothetical protein